MLLRSHSERKALPGLTALLNYNFTNQREVTPSTPLFYTPQDSIFKTQSPTFSPPWVTQAILNLEKGEKELESLRERQQAEIEEVNRELDNAVIEAQREERRLLEKVEQDHREAQRQLTQVKRENAAAVRVLQTLVDKQLRKIGQLREQIQRWGFAAAGSNKDQVQKDVAEVTQPWEISLTLKRVHFLPSSQSKTFYLGEVDVCEQGMTYHVGVCGIQGQKCALHSGEETFSNVTPCEIRKEPQSNRGGQQCSPEEGNKTTGGNMRIVRKLQLSSSTENDEDLKTPKSSIPRPCSVSESSQDEEVESISSDTQGQDLFLSIPTVSSQPESESDDVDGRPNETKRRGASKSRRRQKTFILVSHEEPSCSFEETNEKRSNVIRSPKCRRKGSLSRHGLLDLSTSHLTSFQQSLSKKKALTESSMDSGSPPSPVGSEDCCYTFTLDTPSKESLKQGHYQSMSMADLTGKMLSLSDSDKTEHKGIRKVNRMRLTSTFEQGRGNDRQSRSQTRDTHGLSANHVNRSLSMSAIEGEKLQVKEAKGYKDEKEHVEVALGNLDNVGGSFALNSACLVKQFGKQGSGRTDFNLPSGVHATAKGQLFVVDCGNARIQVTDLQKNIVQQVSPSGPERSSRICNYFDVAVNSRGLIALTCAAERAVLVFSRHGRLLQTFGGTMVGSTKEELDAPRGITVTWQDDFLVADIKRGTLTALKLDPKTGARLERTMVTGYHRPYLVAACLTTGLMAVTERGNETGRVPCIRVLEPGWNTIRILGVCSGLGPVLTCPWGLCIDSDGDVLVTDWGKQKHCVLMFPSKGVGWPLISDNLSSPRGLTLLPDGHVVVSDSMNHCIKIYRYKGIAMDDGGRN